MANTVSSKNIRVNKKTKPRFIVVREFNGQRSMQEVFEQAIENQVSEQFLRWKESKNC